MKTFYKQVFQNLDRGVRPMDRTEALTSYMQKYFPNLSKNSPQEVDEFIRGEKSYEQMLDIIARAKSIRRIQNANKRGIFDMIEVEKYGPRSLAPIPYTFADETDIVLFEYDRFRDAFSPSEKKNNQVPGTYNQTAITNQRFMYMMNYRKDRGKQGKFGIF